MRHALPQLPRRLPFATIRRASLVLAALALPAPFAANAELQGFRLDPVHTRIVFSIDHAGYSTALGTVSGSQGVLAFDPADWSRARLDVRVPLHRVDLGDEDWSRAARRMLDAEAYPEARFVSDRVEAADADQARVCGTLSMHGTARPLCLEVHFNQRRRESLPPFHDRAGFSAIATLERSDFGIDDWMSLVGDEVQLRIEAEAVRDDDALRQLRPAKP